MATAPPQKAMPANKFSSYLFELRRCLQIQLLPHLTGWRQAKESTKTAIICSRKAALLHFLPHLVPLSSAIALVAINLRSRPVGDNGLARTALQFASKFLEIQIQASLATIMLAFVRARVTGSSTFPFGGLLMPYRIKDLSYLWSLDMWGLFSAMSASTWLSWSTWLFVPLAVILTGLVGPAGAVLMIPRPIDYPLDSFITFLNQTDTVFPKFVDLEDGKLRLESELNKTMYQVFASSDLAFSLFVTDSVGSRKILANRHRQEGPSDSVMGAYEHFSSTTPTQLTSSVLSVWGQSVLGTTPYEGYIKSNSFQPYLTSKCWSDQFDEPMAHPNSAHEFVNFGSEMPYLQAKIPLALLMREHQVDPNDDTIRRWQKTHHVDPIFQDRDTSLSVLFLGPSQSRSFNHSILTVISERVTLPEDDSQNTNSTLWLVMACATDAFWMNSTTYYRSSGVSGGFIENQNWTTVRDHASQNARITLTPSWMHRVWQLSDERRSLQRGLGGWPNPFLSTTLALSSVPQGVNGDPTQFPAYLGPDDTRRQDWNRQQDVSFRQLMGSQKFHNYDTMNFPSSVSNWTDASSLATIDAFIIAELPYGYNASTVLVRLSIAVFMSYIVLVVGYVIYILVTGQVVSSWDSIAELVALALNSQKPEVLENTSVGIDTLETFRRPVNIRVNQDLSAELVFRGSKQAVITKYFKVQPNLKY